ncbi:MAG: LytTR family DNA-binding domain-containing protein [Bacteroidota bacterium]
MRPYRVLIVDDERPARRRLLDLLRPHAGLDVLEPCRDGEDALAVLQDEARTGRPVDVLLLDVQMPELSGFDVLEVVYTLPDVPAPVVIFVTAYDQYALQAFDAHAVDYLLKPYSDERFDQALARALRLAHRSSAEEATEPLRTILDAVRPASPAYIDRIVLKEPDRTWFLPVEDVRWIEAAGVYVHIHTEGRTHLHRALLGELDRLLDPKHFLRIHRSHLVRLDCIRELWQDSHGAFTVVLDDDTRLSLGRSYRETVQERLGQKL